MDMNPYLNLERTLALIKPHAFKHYSSILRRIYLAGFHILQERCVKLSIEQVEKFLKCQQQNVKCNENVSMEIKELSSGPLIAMCLAKENAIAAWLDLMGPEDCCVAREKAPTSLRALYGDDNECKNAVHGSKCASDALAELHFFFSNMIPESISRNVDDINDYLCHNIMQPLTNALYELLKVKPVEPLEWIAKYVLDHNTNQPLIDSACTEIFQLIEELKKNEECEEEEDVSGRKLSCGCSVQSQEM